MQEIASYFNTLGFSSKETDIFVTLWKLGANPASTIASVCGYERVYTYKILQMYVQEGLVAETLTKGVKHFWVPSLDVLKEYIQKHEQKYRTLDDQFAYIQTSFESLGKSNKTNMPKLQLFEKQVGVKSMFEDMLGEISRQNLITIKFFGTNTFETQILSSTTLQSYSSAFFTQLQRQSITLQSYLADGSLTMEHITYLESIKSLDNLPAGNNAINIFIIGKVFYLLIFKEQPIGLKLESPELAWAMHFLLEQVVRKT